MQITTRVGDVLKAEADVLISTANPWLNLSGGVNGAILAATGPKIQEELHAFLKQKGTSAVPAGTVVPTEAGSLPFRCILHPVAIDPFYDSSVELVRRTVVTALEMATQRDAKTISMPTFATGYGPMSIGEFGIAIKPLKGESWFQDLVVTVVVRNDADRTELDKVIGEPNAERTGAG